MFFLVVAKWPIDPVTQGSIPTYINKFSLRRPSAIYKYTKSLSDKYKKGTHFVEWLRKHKSKWLIISADDFIAVLHSWNSYSLSITRFKSVGRWCLNKSLGNKLIKSKSKYDARARAQAHTNTRPIITQFIISHK